MNSIDDYKGLIGLRVKALRGTRSSRKRDRRVPLEYILFDNDETFIELREQDPYDYHDCASYARILHLQRNGERWRQIAEDEVNYGDATEDFYYYAG